MRLVPRFSLRFALLALTVFLIVFGVGVSYWRAYQEHERVASELMALGNKVEEESETWFGYVVAKRITGVVFKVRDDSHESLALLRQLPHPKALRRLTLWIMSTGDASGWDFASHPFSGEAMTIVAGFSALEHLDLSIVIKPGELQPLRALKQLRVLNCHQGSLPAGELAALLPALPNLEILRLNGVKGGFAWDEVLHSSSAKLRELFLQVNQDIERLPLTKQGLGRFPELEYLVLQHVRIHSVQIESAALPKLKYLDLSCTVEECRVDWPLLSQAAPNLVGLDLDQAQITSETIDVLTQFKSLQHLHLTNDFSIEALQEKLRASQYPADGQALPVEVFSKLLARCGHLKFHRHSDVLWHELYLTEINLNKLKRTENSLDPSWPSWNSDHWRGVPFVPGTGGGSGGLF
jgi:hypothetical protein